jgi:hypothetical protein
MTTKECDICNEEKSEFSITGCCKQQLCLDCFLQIFSDHKPCPFCKSYNDLILFSNEKIDDHMRKREYSDAINYVILLQKIKNIIEKDNIPSQQKHKDAIELIFDMLETSFKTVSEYDYGIVYSRNLTEKKSTGIIRYLNELQKLYNSLSLSTKKKIRRKSVRRKSVRRKSARRKSARRKSVRRKSARRKSVRRKSVRRKSARRKSARRKSVRRKSVRRKSSRRKSSRRKSSRRKSSRRKSVIKYFLN